MLIALRGCDGLPKDDPSKPLIRAYRGVVLKRAVMTDQSFIAPLPEDNEVDAFLSSLDHYPVHWLTHFMHAIEIVGYLHPERTTREMWLYLYTEMVYRLHLAPETRQMMELRLADGPVREED